MIPTHQRSIETVDLTIAFGQGNQGRQVVDRVSFTLAAGESYGLIGESGCGKSTILRALAGLNSDYQGAILFDNKEQQPMRDKPFYRQVQMVFQDPYASLHPRKMVYNALLEPLKLHGSDDMKSASARYYRRWVQRCLQIPLPPSALRWPTSARGDCPGVDHGAFSAASG